jgi:Ca2+-binding EF-hand superfamily protein
MVRTFVVPHGALVKGHHMYSLQRWGSLLISAAGMVGVALAQAPQGAVFRELFLELDANQDGAIVKEEVPAKAQQAFERLLKRGDRNHDGKLQADEYKAVLEDVRDFAQQAKEKAIQKFQSMDKDKDGKVSREEFTGVRARFDQLDTNGDGFLTQQEIAGGGQLKGIAKPGGAFKKKAAAARAELVERFQSLDKNADGRLSREEFPGNEAQFARLDADQDGFVSRAELSRSPAAVKKKAG